MVNRIAHRQNDVCRGAHVFQGVGGGWGGGGGGGGGEGLKCEGGMGTRACGREEWVGCDVGHGLCERGYEELMVGERGVRGW